VEYIGSKFPAFPLQRACLFRQWWRVAWLKSARSHITRDIPLGGVFLKGIIAPWFLFRHCEPHLVWQSWHVCHRLSCLSQERFRSWLVHLSDKPESVPRSCP